ncbi:MAG TPA: vanadium-dependent haloperoxidase [Candidatus Limnocylindria bacterium]|nr:vanadium-dependent haloperoxidase [Candidatus Limnocylindria bacterium]
MTAATVAAIGLEPLLGGKHSIARAEENGGLTGGARANESQEIRINVANRERAVHIPNHPTNGDEVRHADQANTFTKCLPHDNFGRVDLNAFTSFVNALRTGAPEDFAKIIMGGTRTMNGPQGGYAFDLEGTDAYQFGAPLIPPAPSLASDLNAAELLEHYWASLLRDVPFTQYASSPLAVAAAAETSGISVYQGPRNAGGRVTPELLFRGAFPGETLGPYISQFFVTPTSFGQQSMSQQQVTYLPNIDYMTDFSSWLLVQNGIDTGQRNQNDPQVRYLHNGRGLATWTHADVLYQAYLVAFLVLNTIRAPMNPGNPYIGSNTENGFGTFGGPDIAATLTEVATRALKAVWFQKWQVHLRARPEATGGLVHLIKTGEGDKTDGKLSNIILNSHGLQESFDKYGSWLLSQAFPEGSPAHPAYPTGHGTVGGACITVLKFFFDGNFVIPNPVVPTDDGLLLVPYNGSDADQITVNGELNKLGHNVSFGHGIHAGIHWRSDTDVSLKLGEAVALSVLHDRAQTYNEKFTVHLTKFDGTTATISNH